jgi:hypothetical protein
MPQVNTWEPCSPAQMRALGRLGRLKDKPARFIVGFPADVDDHIIVVPASKNDRRRWDISKGGKISRSAR